MQITVDLTDGQLKALNRICSELRMSQAGLIHHAICEFHEKNLSESIEDLPGFGCWSDHVEDGLEYQQRIRQEWEKKS